MPSAYAWQKINKIKLIVAQEPFAVMYLDLDSFKAYNDKYGFERGDKVLLLTSNVLSLSIAKSGSVDDFLGHIDGDDFILITKPDSAQNMHQQLLNCLTMRLKASIIQMIWLKAI